MSEDTEQIAPQDELFAAAQLLWSAKPPVRTAASYDELLEARRSALEKANALSPEQWRQERDRQYKLQVREAQEANEAKQPDRDQVNRQIAEAERLLSQPGLSEEARDTLQLLAAHLKKELVDDPDLRITPRPAKPSVNEFRAAHLASVKAELASTQHKADEARRAEEAYAQAQRHLAHVQQAQTMYPIS